MIDLDAATCKLHWKLELGGWDLKGGVVDRLQLGGWSSISNQNLDMVVDVVTCDPSLMICDLSFITISFQSTF